MKKKTLHCLWTLTRTWHPTGAGSPFFLYIVYNLWMWLRLEYRHFFIFLFTLTYELVSGVTTMPPKPPPPHNPSFGHGACTPYPTFGNCRPSKLGMNGAFWCTKKDYIEPFTLPLIEFPTNIILYKENYKKKKQTILNKKHGRWKKFLTVQSKWNLLFFVRIDRDRENRAALKSKDHKQLIRMAEKWEFVYSAHELNVYKTTKKKSVRSCS